MVVIVIIGMIGIRCIIGTNGIVLLYEWWWKQDKKLCTLPLSRLRPGVLLAPWGLSLLTTSMLLKIPRYESPMSVTEFFSTGVAPRSSRPANCSSAAASALKTSTTWHLGPTNGNAHPMSA